LRETTFKTKIGGGLGHGKIQKIRDPYLFLQPLKLATSNLVATQLGFGISLPKSNVQDRNWRGPGPGKHLKKFGTTDLFLQPTEKLVHNRYYSAAH